MSLTPLEAEMLAVLKAVEWQGADWSVETNCCPSCYEHECELASLKEIRKHKPDCALRAAIDKAESIKGTP